ncbi:MAG: hypothetical protein ABIT37_14520 [Luteolibacter sp.]
MSSGLQALEKPGFYDGSFEIITPGDLKRFDADGGAANPFWKGNL